MLFKWSPEILNNWYDGMVIVEADSVDKARAIAKKNLIFALSRPDEDREIRTIGYASDIDEYKSNLEWLKSDLDKEPDVIPDGIYWEEGVE